MSYKVSLQADWSPEDTSVHVTFVCLGNIDTPAMHKLRGMIKPRAYMRWIITSYFKMIDDFIEGYIFQWLKKVWFGRYALYFIINYMIWMLMLKYQAACYCCGCWRWGQNSFIYSQQDKDRKSEESWDKWWDRKWKSLAE